MLTYAEIADKVCHLIYAAIVHEVSKEGESAVKAMLDPYNPRGSTDHVSFITAKQNLWTTGRDRSHINYVVCDSDWEGELARVVEAHPKVISYVKNQALGFEVPYRLGSVAHRYIPDFIIQIDDGREDNDPLNLVVEVKGYRGVDAQIKAETMRTHWVPGVNNLDTFGRWAFAEFTDVFAMEDEFSKLIERFIPQETEI